MHDHDFKLLLGKLDNLFLILLLAWEKSMGFCQYLLLGRVKDLCIIQVVFVEYILALGYYRYVYFYPPIFFTGDISKIM